ncbi:unnamed protein product [Paramecium pentaurelia]|uniref:Uncharacterized protein n=1 Tax=Paramecium pentaurelia TaxID=43138 RepID=A0A8S1SCB9_9CILI|nr:unnamed protein product [Paramecium pentaurelia]
MSEEDSQELESEQEEEEEEQEEVEEQEQQPPKDEFNEFRKYNAFSTYAQLERGQQQQYNNHNPLEYYYQNNIPIPYQPQVNDYDRLQRHQNQIDNANFALKMLQNPKIPMQSFYDNYPPSQQQYNTHFYQQENFHHQQNNYQMPPPPPPQYQRKRSYDENIPNPYQQQQNDQRRRNSFKEQNVIPNSHMPQYPIKYQQQQYSPSPNLYVPQQQQVFQQPNQYHYQQPIQDEYDYYQSQNYPKQYEDNVNNNYQHQQRPSRPPIPKQNGQKEENKLILFKNDDQQIDQEYLEFIHFKEAAKKQQKIIDENEYQDFIEFKKSKLQQQTNNVGQINQQKQIKELYKRTNQISNEDQLRPKFNETKFERKPGENYKQKYVAPQLDAIMEIQKAMQILMKK